MTPEAKARVNIDKMLAAAGYVLQDMSGFNRTGIHHTLKKNPLRESDLDEFVKCYNSKNRRVRKEKSAAIATAVSSLERLIGGVDE